MSTEVSELDYLSVPPSGITFTLAALLNFSQLELQAKWNHKTLSRKGVQCMNSGVYRMIFSDLTKSIEPCSGSARFVVISITLRFRVAVFNILYQIPNVRVDMFEYKYAPTVCFAQDEDTKREELRCLILFLPPSRVSRHNLLNLNKEQLLDLATSAAYFWMSWIRKVSTNLREESSRVELALCTGAKLLEPLIIHYQISALSSNI